MKLVDKICLICGDALKCAYNDEYYYCCKIFPLKDKYHHIFSLSLTEGNSINDLRLTPKSLNNILYVANFKNNCSHINIYDGFNHVERGILIPKILLMDFPNLENFINRIKTYLVLS